MQDLPYSLMAELEKTATEGLPPVHLWHPDVEKSIDLVVKADGTWVYEGEPIKRPRLVRLFASVLRREGDEYSLVTPVEKCLIKVEDVPFLVVLADTSGEGETLQIMLTTNMGEEFTVDAEHPIRIAQRGDEWIPYVQVRGGMEARLERSVYYQLADCMTRGVNEVTGEIWLGLYSGGTFFPFMQA